MNATVDLISRISRILARMAGALILLSAVLVSLDVVFRNIFRMTMFESFELTSYAIALAVTFGFAWSLVTKAHIRIEVIYNTLSIKPRCYFDALALGVLAVVAIVLTYWGAQVALDSYEMQARSNSTLAIPMVWPQGLWVVGLVWFAVCAVALFMVALYGLATRRYKDVQALFGVASVEEEIGLSVEQTVPQPGIATASTRAGTASQGSR